MKHLTVTLDQNVKDIPAALKVLEKIDGVSTVVQVFPGDEDPEFVRFVVIKLMANVNVKEVKALIESSNLAESVELAPERTGC